MRTRLLLGIVAVSTIAAWAPGAGAMYDNRIFVPIGCVRITFAYKPRAMCFNNGQNFRRLVWKSYGGKRAIADGQYERNNCVPNCAEGTSTWVATKVFLFHVRWACGRRVYTREAQRSDGRYPVSLWVSGFDRCPR
jgi:hypothetical protein